MSSNPNHKDMKKILTLLFGLSLGLMNQTFASSNSERFSYDDTLIMAEMSQLTLLENLILQQPNLTVEDLRSSNKLPDHFSTPIELYRESSLNEKIGGIGGFWWGFCPGFCLTPVAGGIAVLIVHLAGKDSHETKQAAIGCAIGTLAEVMVGVVYWVIAVYFYGATAWY